MLCVCVSARVRVCVCLCVCVCVSVSVCVFSKQQKHTGLCRKANCQVLALCCWQTQACKFVRNANRQTLTVCFCQAKAYMFAQNANCQALLLGNASVTVCGEQQTVKRSVDSVSVQIICVDVPWWVAHCANQFQGQAARTISR